jgi:hypothetical protein
MPEAGLIEKHFLGREARLWRAVIFQARLDATMNIHLGPSRQSRTLANTEALARHRARHWLTGFSRDFREVCELAGFEPELVRDAGRRLEKKGWKI